MEEAFYRERLTQRYGLTVLTPDTAERELVHRVIYEELVMGEIREESRRAYAYILRQMAAQGAHGVILGCTEIGLLVKPEDSPVPLFDTTRIHAETAVDWALK